MDFYTALATVLKGYNPYRDGEGQFASGPGGGFAPAHPAVTRVNGVWQHADGTPASQQIQDRLKALRVPPGWKDVELANDPDAKVLARGVDSKGRTVTKRSAKATEAASAEKFARLQKFNSARKKAVAKAMHDLVNGDERKAVHATVLLLLDRTGFRPGSDRDTKAAVKAFGATTLEAQHVRVEGDTLHFDFTGKKGVRIQKSLQDAMLADQIRPRHARGGRLFEVTDASMRDYLQQDLGAKGFKLKDFRTWNGTAKALEVMKTLPKPTTATAFKKAQRAVATAVSEHLGNTPSVALNSYIDPSVWARWDR